MSEATGHDLSRLSPAAGRLGAAFARPKVLAAICVVALAGLGWLALGLMAAATGMFDALCRPLTTGAWSAISFAIVAAMWGAMTFAMMLPSAAPMIMTYAEIADTAARKGERIVSPFVLASGYVSVWLGFAAAATFVQCVFAHFALLDAGMAPASGLFSGVDLYRRRHLSILGAQARLPDSNASSRSRFSFRGGRPRRAAFSNSV